MGALGDATTSAHGLMSASDKTKLDAIGVNANVVGPSSAINNRVVVFSGNTGRAIKDSGYTIAKSVPSDAVFTDTKVTNELYRPTSLSNGGINDVTIQPLVSELRANHLAFLSANQIIIEQTIDGGVTWTDAGISDEDKIKLFSEQRPSIYLPLINGEKNMLGQLRVTFTAKRYNVPQGTPETEKYNYWNTTYVLGNERYNQIQDFYFWLNSSSDRINIKIERSRGVSPTTWEVAFDDDSVLFSGWSGNDFIRLRDYAAFGGNEQYIWNYRITFKPAYNPGQSELTQSYITHHQGIGEIRAYGPCWWDAGNSYASNDHLYSFDYQKNATFPATVSATNFLVDNQILPKSIQINGNSIVNNGIANIPLATASNIGVVKVNPLFGTAMRSSPNEDTIMLSKATADTIKSGTQNYQPIVPSYQQYAVFYGLAKAAGDTTQAATQIDPSTEIGIYTNSAKSAIQSMLGIIQIPAVTSTDEGKVLRVVNGEWSAVSLPSVSEVSW